MMKNRYEKAQPGRFSFDECPITCLWINIESYGHLIDNHLEYITRDVSNGCVTNKQVIAETLELINRAGELTQIDISKRCVQFIDYKYPHALFGSYEETIAVENLSADEMLDCLQQEGLSFGYGREDKSGNPIENEAE